MGKGLLNFLKLFLSIGLAGILLFLVFRNMEWAAFWERAKQVNYSWVIASILLSIIAYVARAYRWNILLEPMGYQLKTSRTTLAVLVGYMANLALPRLGEVTRCGILKRNDNVPIPQSLGSVVSERIVDVLTLLFLILFSLTIEADRLFKFLSESYSSLEIPSFIIYLLFALSLLGIVVLVWFIRKKEKLKDKFGKLISGFAEGLISLKSIKHPLGFILSTIIIWIVYYLMSYIIVFSLPETSHLDIGAGFMLLITGGIAISIPVQSGFGTYHGMIAGMLLLYNIDQTTGIFLATLLHTSQIVAIALFGSLALIISFFLQKK